MENDLNLNLGISKAAFPKMSTNMDVLNGHGMDNDIGATKAEFSSMNMSDLEASLKQLAEPSSLNLESTASFPKMDKSSNAKSAFSSMDMSDLEAQLKQLAEPSSLNLESTASFPKMDNSSNAFSSMDMSDLEA